MFVDNCDPMYYTEKTFPTDRFCFPLPTSRFPLLFLLLLFSASLPAAESLSLEQALERGAKARAAWREDKPDPAETLEAASLRTLQGKHLTLYTDLPASPEIERLPEIFDAAVPLWCEFFRIDPKSADSWKMTGVLIGDSNRFAKTTLLRRVPHLNQGYSIGHWLWVREQRGDYYRRHLLLHEGVHGLMNHFFGGCGPRWYMEGLAELLATHRWDEKKHELTIRYMPRNSEDVPRWGRIQLVQKNILGKEKNAFEAVLHTPFDENDYQTPYARSWAIAAFFDGHSLYRDRLRDAAPNVTLAAFNAIFFERIDDDLSRRLPLDWADFLANLEYGYDFERTTIESFEPGEPLKRQPLVRSIRADRGWQSSDIFLEQGKTYSFRAQGRFRLGEDGGVLWSEPNGITIRYNRGKPLGMLLGAVVPDSVDLKNEVDCFAEPIEIGNETVWACPRSGTLFLRINDSAGELADNAGTAEVRIEPQD